MSAFTLKADKSDYKQNGSLEYPALALQRSVA
jgi:hypothetical protein